MTDDTQAAREAFEGWASKGNLISADVKTWSKEDGLYLHPRTDNFFQIWLAASRSIPAAAALLREAGWTVLEPRCQDCSGSGWASEKFDAPGISGARLVRCPTCNGTGARP